MERLDYARLDAHASEGDARSGLRERFHAPGIEVELRWAPAGDAFFVVLPPERAATGRHEMYSLFFDVWEASAHLYGRRLPGVVTERTLHGQARPDILPRPLRNVGGRNPGSGRPDSNTSDGRLG